MLNYTIIFFFYLGKITTKCYNWALQLRVNMNSNYRKLNKHLYEPREYLDDEAKIENYYRMLNEVLPKKNNLSLSQQNILNHIKNSIDVVEHILEPFRKFNIDYDLIITGGAIYDLVLNLNDIKDIDIVISFQKGIKYYYEAIEYEAFNEEFSSLLAPLYYEVFHEIKKIFYPKDLTYLISTIATQSYQLENTFYSKDGKTEEYINRTILGICKINDSNLSKPIDLIISTENAEHYPHFFDFSLCKMAMVYKNSRVKCDKDDLINHIFIMKHSLYDIYQKTLTLRVDKFQKEHIEYFLNKHFLRLKEKLPNYEPIFYGHHQEKVEFARSIAEKNLFELNLFNQEDKKRIKI